MTDPKPATVSVQTTAVRWTTEPPTVTGWYWWREAKNFPPSIVKVDGVWVKEDGVLWNSSEFSGLWWTVPILEPPRCQ